MSYCCEEARQVKRKSRLSGSSSCGTAGLSKTESARSRGTPQTGEDVECIGPPRWREGLLLTGE